MSCKTKDCTRESRAHGLCLWHYNKERRKNIRIDDVEDFWTFVKEELKIAN
jgi:hypothetical protein